MVRRVQDKAALVVVTPSGKPYELVALDPGTRDVWLNHLMDACGGARARAPTIKTMPKKLQGWLKKKPGPGKLKPWKRHWFSQVEGDLVEFASDETGEPRLASLALLDINNVDVTYEDGISPTFEIKTLNTTWYLLAGSEEDLEYWTAGLAQFWEGKKRGGSNAKRASEQRRSKRLSQAPAASPKAESVLEKLDALEEEEGGGNDEGRQPRESGAPRAARGLYGPRGGDDEGLPDPSAVDTVQEDDFESLMSALGSEKSKLNERLSQIEARKQSAPASRAAAPEEEEDDVDAMFGAVIPRDKEPKSASPAGDKRERRATDVQRRIDAKKAEMEHARSGGNVAAAIASPPASSNAPKAPPKSAAAVTAAASSARPKSAGKGNEDTEWGALVTDDPELADAFGDDDLVASAKLTRRKDGAAAKARAGSKSPPPARNAPPPARTAPTAPKSAGKGDEGARSGFVDVSSGSIPNLAVTDNDDDDEYFSAPPKKTAAPGAKPSAVSAKTTAPAPKHKKRVKRAKQEGPWTVNDRVMAQFDGDNLWYKARVLRVYDGEQYQVLFLGYGNKQECDADMLLPIPDEDLTDGDEVEVTDSDGADSDAELPPPQPLSDGSDDESDGFGALPPPTKAAAPSVLAASGSVKQLAPASATKPAPASAKPAPQVTPADEFDFAPIDFDDDFDLDAKKKPAAAMVKKPEAAVATKVDPPKKAGKGNDLDHFLGGDDGPTAGKKADPKKAGGAKDHGLDDFLYDEDAVAPRAAASGKKPNPAAASKPLSSNKAGAAKSSHLDDSLDDDEDGFVSPRGQAGKKSVDLDDFLEPEMASPRGGVAATKRAGASPRSKLAPLVDSDEDEDGLVAPPPPDSDDEDADGVATRDDFDREALQIASDEGPDHDRCGIFQAASSGDVPALKKILDAGAVYVDYRKRREPKGWSALHFAVQSCQDAAVELLLARGADVNLRDDRDKPVVHKAVSEDEQLPVLKRLLSAGVDLLATSDTGATVLHEVRCGEAARLVLAALKPVQRKQLLAATTADGLTPLHVAAANRFGSEVCRVFIETDLVDVNVVDELGETPLFSAVRTEALESMGVLLEAGCSISQLNNKRMDVFQLCLRDRTDFALELLLCELNQRTLRDVLQWQLDNDMELESRFEDENRDDDDDDADAEAALNPEAVARHVKALTAAFKRKRSPNVARQVVALLRLGEEYLRAEEFYFHAAVCLNAARALVHRHRMSSEAMSLMGSALLWHITAVMVRTHS